MTRKWLALLGMVLLAAQAGAAEKPFFKAEKDKVGYALGVDLARNLKKQGIEVDADAMANGLKDEFAGQKPRLTEDEIRKIVKEFQGEVRRKQARDRKIAAIENKQKGDAFLAENGKKEGVVTLPDGLQYKVLKEGQGKKPTENDKVEVHYRGTLINGTEFDSSYNRGQPTTFPVKGVIRGWREALQLMPVGSKWQIFIPAPLAYGERGSGQAIGPNETLIFELDLLAIK
jgi:FKBP-type peptidyl-prolyl cis-trans isomerase FklB